MLRTSTQSASSMTQSVAIMNQSNEMKVKMLEEDMKRKDAAMNRLQQDLIEASAREAKLKSTFRHGSNLSLKNIIRIKGMKRQHNFVTC